MANETKKIPDESLAEFYQEQLIPHADLVYRFAFTLTLSLDSAIKMVKSVYLKTASQVSPAMIRADANSKAMMLAETWLHFQEIKGKKPATPTAALAKKAIKLFESLQTESRAALFLVDIAGLDVKDASKIIGLQDSQFRPHLGQARNLLIGGSFDT